MAIVRDFKIGLIMLDFISIRLAKCETLAKYCNHKHCRWLSGDPALNDYIPKAPINYEVKKDNENLPGMGGVYNTVNLHVYHYAGNNPVKYTDPDGRDIILLNISYGAFGFGHNAILIGDDTDGWIYYSKMAIVVIQDKNLVI